MHPALDVTAVPPKVAEALENLNLTFVRYLGEGATGIVMLAERLDQAGEQKVLRAVKYFDRDRYVENLKLQMNGGRRGRALPENHLDLVNRVAQEVSNRFKTEAWVAKHLTHSSFVTYFAAESAYPYVVMEYAPGEMLDDHVARALSIQFDGDRRVHTPFASATLAEKTLQDLVCLFLQLAEGLEYAHHQGIFHRDVKPSNIIVSTDPAGVHAPRARLLDLGIAKMSAELVQGLEHTVVNTMHGTLGTPGFMAPEQRGSAESAGSPADVFALGQTILMAMTGNIADWGEMTSPSGQTVAGPQFVAPPVRERAASIRSDITRWLHYAISFQPHVERHAKVQGTLTALADLIAGMVQLGWSDRIPIADVVKRLRGLATADQTATLSSQDASVAVRFPTAVREWEVDRSTFPHEAELVPFLEWAKRTQLAPGEEQFLLAFVAHVTEQLRRARAQAQLEEASARENLAAALTARSQANASASAAAKHQALAEVNKKAATTNEKRLRVAVAVLVVVAAAAVAFGVFALTMRNQANATAADLRKKQRELGAQKQALEAKTDELEQHIVELQRARSTIDTMSSNDAKMLQDIQGILKEKVDGRDLAERIQKRLDDSVARQTELEEKARSESSKSTDASARLTTCRSDLSTSNDRLVACNATVTAVTRRGERCEYDACQLKTECAVMSGSCEGEVSCDGHRLIQTSECGVRKPNCSASSVTCDGRTLVPESTCLIRSGGCADGLDCGRGPMYSCGSAAQSCPGICPPVPAPAQHQGQPNAVPNQPTDTPAPAE